MKVALCLVTLNAGPLARQFLTALHRQTLNGLKCFAIDSMSQDGTAEIFRDAGFEVEQISPQAFDHGGTRQRLVNICTEADVVIFMTQDAILAETSALESLVDAFSDPEIGAAYGRQLPLPGAGLDEQQARLYNYPVESSVKNLADRQTLGLKAAFFSNSFGAYRREALNSIGGFPERQIFGEDMYVTAKMLLANWKIAYCSTARVYHSHEQALPAIFRRNFDIGVYHADNPWLLREFGAPESEGLRLLRAQLQAYWRKSPLHLHQPVVRNLTRYLAYRLGRAHACWPRWLKQRLSSQPAYWIRN